MKKKVYIPKARMNRFDFFGLENSVTIKTFSKDVYTFHYNFLVQNTITKEYKKLSDIFYDIRTVRTLSGIVVAKRKNQNSDLFEIKSRQAASKVS
ncbi:hypothetical protein UP12_19695 (plasmid) [Bacillus pumilus]|uniref:hypothetical protein n=1 Tax=Bacillus pumilus TaxID=1408 RepID=UPI0007764F42|nr:hypothetical protein [Bacillus pumilus]AMM99626.1 hypothetical protein UP12_19695 [Bacillus pumilus]